MWEHFVPQNEHKSISVYVLVRFCLLLFVLIRENHHLSTTFLMQKMKALLGKAFKGICVGAHGIEPRTLCL
jgi:hypothetical protein